MSLPGKISSIMRKFLGLFRPRVLREIYIGICVVMALCIGMIIGYRAGIQEMMIKAKEMGVGDLYIQEGVKRFNWLPPFPKFPIEEANQQEKRK